MVFTVSEVVDGGRMKEGCQRRYAITTRAFKSLRDRHGLLLLGVFTYMSFEQLLPLKFRVSA